MTVSNKKSLKSWTKISTFAKKILFFFEFFFEDLINLPFTIIYEVFSNQVKNKLYNFE